MAINLQKGQKISLTKEDQNLKNIMVGLGWDPVQKENKGFLSSIFSSATSNFDCDASVLLLNEFGKIDDKKDIIYFGNLVSTDGSVRHMGDNITGEGEGDDEQIMIDLSKVSEKVHALAFVVNIYKAKDRHQDFGMVDNAYIRVINMNNNQEMLKYSLTKEYDGKTAMIFAQVYRHNGEWKFSAIGEGTVDSSLSDIVKKYV